MSNLMAAGNYSNCKLLEAVLADSDYGPQWNLTFNVDGVNRTVYLSLDEEHEFANGKKAIALTVETLQALGFNGDANNPKFAPEVYTDGVELYCKHNTNSNGETKERWYVSTGFKPTPAAKDVLNNFNVRWKAMTGGSPKPAASRPATAPTRSAPSAAPQRPGAAPKRPNDKPTELLCKNADECWSHVSEMRKDMTSEIYFKGIAEQEKQSGKVEADFTPEDWHMVAKFLTSNCPF